MRSSGWLPRTTYKYTKAISGQGRRNMSRVTMVTTQPVSNSNESESFPGVSVRTLRNTREHAEFAARLIVEGFKGKYVHNITEAKLPIAVRHLTAFHLAQADDFRSRTFVAELDGSPVGVIALRFHGDTDIITLQHVAELGGWHALRYICFGLMSLVQVPRDTCYIENIAVEAAVRGLGVGRVLMERAEMEARHRQCKLIFLDVTTDNRARNLYERHGYSVTETTSKCGCLGWCIGPPGRINTMAKLL